MNIEKFMTKIGEYGEKRKLTPRQVEAYILCHHDFQGLTTEQTAAIMGITPGQVSKLLQRMEKNAPQLFPILTKLQAEMHHKSIGIDNNSVSEMAESMNITPESVSRNLHTARAKLGLPFKSHGRPLQFCRDMESQVKEKF